MLIDIHAYIGHWPFRQLRGNTCGELVKRMDDFGVDLAVVSNINGIFYKNTQPANEELYEAIQSSPEFKKRLIPFAVINPTYPGWEDDLDICQSEFGMKGVRIYPLYHDYSIDDPQCAAFVEKLRDRDMPVAISLRMIDLRQHSWHDVGDELDLNDIAGLVRKVPDAKYMVLDTRIREGMNATTPESERILRQANILFDSTRGSGVPVVGPNGAGLEQIIGSFGADKVAFGTETPFIDYYSPFIRIDAYRCDEKTRDLIRFGNAKRMLGMK